MRILYALPQQAGVPFTGIHMFMVGLLLTVILRRCQAATHLAFRGLGAEASTITRSALEALFILTSFLSDPQRVLTCLDQGDAHSKFAWGNSMVETEKKKARLTPEQLTMVRETIERNKLRPRSPLNYEAHAKWGDMEIHYTTLYRALSTKASHVTATMLDSHATWTDEVRQIEFGPDDDTATQVIYSLTVLLNALMAVVTKFEMKEFDTELSTWVVYLQSFGQSASEQTPPAAA